MEYAKSSEAGGAGGRSSRFNDKKKKKGKKKTSFRKKRPPINIEFSYRDLNTLVPFLTEEGKIVAARVSGLRAFQQRKLTLAVKRARQIGFVSPVNRDTIH